METVKAFAIMTPIIGGILVFCSCLAPCFTVAPAQWKLGGMLFIVLSLFQGLTLLIIRSNVCNDNPARNFLVEKDPLFDEVFSEKCEWDVGFKLSISAVVCFFVAGVATFMIPSPVKSLSDPPQTQEVKYQQNTDGTVEETDVIKGTAVPQGTPAPEEEEVEC
jgi:hypothetical protein